MSGACIRFSWFISISYSKSEIARRPFTIARAPTRSANSTMSTSNDAERTFGRGSVPSSMKLSGCSAGTSVPPLRTGWFTIATTTSSNSTAARLITSRWPFVIGSYEPGQTAMRGSGGMAVDADERVAVAAFVRQGQGELERGAAVALGHHPSAAGQQRLERRGELSPQPRSAPVGGIEEDQIVCVSAGGCAAEGRAGRSGAHLGLRRDQPEGVEVGADRGPRAGVALDEQGARGAPRQRLDAQGTRAREQVEDARAVERAERREQRLAHAVGRRPRVAARRRLQAAPADPPRYAPHAVMRPRPPSPRPPRARRRGARARGRRAPGPRRAAGSHARGHARARRRPRAAARTGSARGRTGASR